MSSGQPLNNLFEGFVDIITAEEVKIRFGEGKALRIKYGADPSAPDLHLGHTVPLRKLRQFQDAGHRVVFIIGDFTAMIGDPTHRSETRKMLTKEEVAENALSYQEQVFKILDPAKTEVRYNSEWLSKLTPHEFLHLTAQYTVARLLERDDFQKRYRSNQPIAVVEFLYPLMQGYDSVIVKADMEVGGTDQKFNLLVGRELQKVWGQKPQIVATLPIIEGMDGAQKMSKSLGNHIALKDPPSEMFGKIMSIPDALLERYYEYLTAFTREEIAQVKAGLKDGSLHPRNVKADLGAHLVAFYHGPAAAEKARAEFDEVFKNKGLPADIPTVEIAAESLDMVSLLHQAGLVASKGEGRRLLEQGGVRLNQEKVQDATQMVKLSGEPVLIQCGKRKFAKVKRA